MSEIVELLKSTKKEGTAAPKTFDKSAIRLTAIISFVLILFIVAGYLIFTSVYLNRLYWDYVGELSNSTVYAYEHEGITVTDHEETYLITDSYVYVFYKKFSTGEFRKVNKNINSQLGSLHLEFGNGSNLDVWEVENASSSKDFLYLEYKNTKGRLYKCNVEGLTLETLRKFLAEYEEHNKNGGA